MLRPRKCWLSSALIGLLSFGSLSLLIHPLSVSAQEKTYNCARFTVRFCVGQLVWLPNSSVPGRVTKITDSTVVLDGHAFVPIWHLRQSGVRVGPPPGSYLRSCRDLRVDGNTLYASCRTKDGNWRNTSLYFYNCTGDDLENNMGNNDGRLACDPL